MKSKKNMKLGNKIYLILLAQLILFNSLSAEQKITTSPLINIEEIKPSFEGLMMKMKKFP